MFFSTSCTTTSPPPQRWPLSIQGSGRRLAWGCSPPLPLPCCTATHWRSWPSSWSTSGCQWRTTVAMSCPGPPTAWCPSACMAVPHTTTSTTSSPGATMPPTLPTGTCWLVHYRDEPKPWPISLWTDQTGHHSAVFTLPFTLKDWSIH